MARRVPEWEGRTDDAMPPPHVRARIFDRCGGKCHISGRKIRPGDKWDLDHIVALCNGGKNIESNLAPALADKHKEKTAEDRAEKADVDHKRLKHLGIRKPSRGFQKPEGYRYSWRTGRGTIERRNT
jgi:5-methylcytosine-specific restriction protein A